MSAFKYNINANIYHRERRIIMEERIPDNTIVKENDNGAKLEIINVVKTDNLHGYGVYLYQFKNQLSKGFGLYRNEFTIITTSKESIMFLVMMHCFAENTDIPCKLTETRDKAVEWIDKEMKDKKYHGGCHQIHEIKVYK